MPVPNPDVQGRPSEVPLLPPSDRSFFLGPIPGTLHHPLVILAWQLLSCALAWSFVIVLARNGEIPLSDILASLINRYQTETTLTATLVATILSAVTTWYFRFVFLCAQQLKHPSLPTSHAGFFMLLSDRRLSHLCRGVFRSSNYVVQ